MSKDPAVLFYTSDFLTGTTTMSNEHVGMYIRLLCIQHQKETRLSEEDMKYICSTYVEQVYKKFIKDEAGFYYNKRMEDEKTKRSNYCNGRSINRAKGWKNKKLQKNTYVVHMENENEDENSINSSAFGIGIKGGVGGNDKFGEFWLVYPKKIGKGAAERAWKKIHKPSETLELIKSALAWQIESEQWVRDGGQYIPAPATYLNQRRWEDEKNIGKHGQSFYRDLE